MKAIGYARVSTEEQATDGVSLDAQVAAIKSYASARNLELVEVVIDAGVSTATPLQSRVGGARVLATTKSKEVQAVISTRLDRLFRDTIECLQTTRAWERAKSKTFLHLVEMSIDTATASGNFVLTIHAAKDEMARKIIGEQTSVAMRYMASQGRHTGGQAPFGLQLLDGQLHEHPEEQAVINAAVAMRAKGANTNAIARALTNSAIVSRSGRPFQAVQVQAMLSTSLRRTEAVRKARSAAPL